MRRRKFIVSLTGTMMLPLIARAQRSNRPVIGFLSARSREDAAVHTAAFLRGLEEAGFVAGQNVAIEYSWAEGHYDLLPALAADLARRGVAVIAAVGGINSALAAKAATSTVPIVFLIGEHPVQLGLVESLHRPGSNITGVSLIAAALGGKRLELLCEVVPGPGQVALLANPANSNTDAHVEDVRAAAAALRRPLLVLYARTEAEFAPAFDGLSRHGVRGLVVQNEAFFDTKRDQLVALAALHAVPAIYHIREFPQAGGLMSYGPSLADAYRKAGVHVARLLKGASAADLPVEQPTTFELIVNLKTAQTLALTIPPSFLARADEAIE